MRNKLHLHIPTPCHEEWNDMKPVQEGRFCFSCQKSVVDFTNMSDAEIINYFKKPSTGSVCGRFQDHQLNRDILGPRKNLPWIKYFFQFALPAFLFSIKGEAQKGKPQIVIETFKDNQVLGKMAATIPEKEFADSVIVNGTVEDAKGSTLPGATVIVKGTNKGVVSNANGSFSIAIKRDTFPVVLITSYVGFQSEERIVKIDNAEFSNLSMAMKLQPQLSGEVIVVGGYVSTKYKRSKRNKAVCEKSESVPFFSRLLKDTLSNRFSVFPNPLSIGQQIAIENKRLSEDNYSVELINLTGQTIYNELAAITGKQRLYLKIPTVSAGIYFVRLTAKKSGKSFSEKIIVQ
jgi:hypothetical protein